MEFLDFWLIIVTIVMSLTNDAEVADNKKRHTVEEKFKGMHITQVEQDSEPEVKKIRVTPEENVRDLPRHTCGKVLLQFDEVSEP